MLEIIHVVICFKISSEKREEKRYILVLAYGIFSYLFTNMFVKEFYFGLCYGYVEF